MAFLRFWADVSHALFLLEGCTDHSSHAVERESTRRGDAFGCGSMTGPHHSFAPSVLPTGLVMTHPHLDR